MEPEGGRTVDSGGKPITPHAATVLLIDDDRLMLSLCCDALEEQGYRTIIATDGLSGIETAVAGRPDLILLDVVMPGIDGFEVCRRLRALPPFGQTPIVLLSASTDLRLEAQGAAAGATVTLSKPFGVGLIVETIRRLLGQDRQGAT
jgi:DNA-binding response OmpR family regulator